MIGIALSVIRSIQHATNNAAASGRLFHFLQRLATFLMFAQISLQMFAQEPNPNSPPPWTGAAGSRETTRELMDRAAAQPAHPQRSRGHFTLDFQNVLPNPDAPIVASWPPESAAAAPAVASPQSLSLNFLAATLADSAFPPDTMGAAGPTQFIVAINNRIRSFNKNTGVADGVLNVDTDSFFQGVMTPPIS